MNPKVSKNINFRSESFWEVLPPRPPFRTQKYRGFSKENELNDLINSDTIDNVERIWLLEGEILQSELEHLSLDLKFKENFTLLEDEKPTKNFLNLESTKGGYNEITIWQEPTLNFDSNKEENLENIKYNVFRDQPLIRDKVSGQFQKFYDLQPNLKTSREELMKFFKSDQDE